MIEQGAVLSTALVSRGLDNAGASNDLQAAQWFRQHGAQWPAVLGRFAYPHCDQWSPELLEWARAEGCTSPAFQHNKLVQFTA